MVEIKQRQSLECKTRPFHVMVVASLTFQIQLSEISFRLDFSGCQWFCLENDLTLETVESSPVQNQAQTDHVKGSQIYKAPTAFLRL